MFLETMLPWSPVPIFPILNWTRDITSYPSIMSEVWYQRDSLFWITSSPNPTLLIFWVSTGPIHQLILFWDRYSITSVIRQICIMMILIFDCGWVGSDKFSSRGSNLPVNLIKISDFHSQLIHLNQCWGYDGLWLIYQVCPLCAETDIYSTFFFLGYLMFKSQLHELFRLKFRLNPRTSNTDLELQSWIHFTCNLHASML